VSLKRRSKEGDREICDRLNRGMKKAESQKGERALEEVKRKS
jgi:hypothetical protein